MKIMMGQRKSEFSVLYRQLYPFFLANSQHSVLDPTSSRDFAQSQNILLSD
jgi:hypothetical protein